MTATVEHVTDVAHITSQGRNRYNPTCSCGWRGKQTRTRSVAIERAMEHHATNRSCPTPWKRRHPNQEQADNHMHKMWRSKRHGGKLPTRVYQCPCGGWHTTAWPAERWAQSSVPDHNTLSGSLNKRAPALREQPGARPTPTTSEGGE